jgi:hypothetical protein
MKKHPELLLRIYPGVGSWPLVIASGESLYELEKLGKKLNCVSSFDVAELKHGDHHVLKRWPK